jgi:hypothetical protein
MQMPIRQITVAVSINPEKTWLDFVGALRLHCLRQALDRTSFFRIDKAMNSLLFVASAGGFTGYDPG